MLSGTSTKRIIVSTALFIGGLLLLFIPATYGGFLNYLIENSIISLNTGRDMLEIQRASIQIYQGASIDFVSLPTRIGLGVAGIVSIYLSVSVLIYGKALFTKKYWTTFKLKPSPHKA